MNQMIGKQEKEMVYVINQKNINNLVNMIKGLPWDMINPTMEFIRVNFTAMDKEIFDTYMKTLEQAKPQPVKTEAVLDNQEIHTN